jgi:hypothetical protein
MRSFAIGASDWLRIALSIVLRGWTLKVLWSWFVAPVFALPLLTLAQATGLGIVVVWATIHAVPLKGNKDRPRRSQQWWMTLCIPPVMVGIGWIVKQFL